MAAALISDTIVGGPISAGSAVNGTGLVQGVYTATIVTTLDWLILGEFSSIKYVHAMVDADGTDAKAYVDGTTENKVFVTGTGAVTLFVIGTPA